MYRCKLDIRIFSEDPLLLADVRNIAPLERFEHEVSGYRSFSPEAVRGSDIIVLDLPVAERPEAVRALCKPGAILVFCMEPEAFAVLRTPSLEAADDIWVKPFHRDFGAVRFKKILAGIKHRKDSRLTQTYLDTIIDSIPDLIWFKDVKGSHLKVNNGFCHAVGKKKEDVQGRGHYYIWDLKKEEYEQGEYICLESDEIFLRNMPFAILISGNDGRIINVNAKFEEYFAAKEKNIVGKPYEEWKHVIQKSLCKTYGEGHFEIRLHGDGEERILEFHEEPIFDVFRNRVGQFCFCRDVTIERTFEHQIWISANTDALTGLYNRRFFYEYMNENRKENQLSLLYVDLDDFKKVNDAHGHHIGDGALELVARLMREAFPRDFIVRLGGDEFLICLVGERSLAFLEEKANRLLQSLLEAFQVSDYLRVMSASIGIASSADPGTKLDDLVRQSDIAMYAAKQSGKSRCCVYSSGLIKK
uniref:diguanylate cyclase domain-containing protein n=1 Tax=Bilophila wadsworthia TaxID=35833 RepID=UPI003FEEC561